MIVLTLHDVAMDVQERDGLSQIVFVDPKSAMTVIVPLNAAAKTALRGKLAGIEVVEDAPA